MDPVDTLLMGLSPERLSHSERVAETARKLAAHWGLSEEKATLAGLLHDNARSLSPEALLEEAEQRGIPLEPLDRCSPVPRLHGLVAAKRAEEAGISDPDVLLAISHHTLGRPGMTPLEQVVFLADWIEPGRNHPGLAEVRELAYHSLAQATLRVLDRTVMYLVERAEPIHLLAIEARNWLIMEEKKKVDRKQSNQR